MTMVADKVEVAQQHVGRPSADTIHNRLGSPLRSPDDDDDTKEEVRPSRGVHNRLGVQNVDHVARKNQKNVRDARDEIRSRRCKQVNDQTYVSGDGYIDENGDYHDTYRACDVKKEEEKKEEEDDSYYDTGRKNSSGVHGRLGSVQQKDRSSSSSLSKDLRNRLRQRDDTPTPPPETRTTEGTIKEEEDDKVNLCIEIKQEIPEGPPGVDEDMDEGDFEF